jgi:hypothetical protein
MSDKPTSHVSETKSETKSENKSETKSENKSVERKEDTKSDNGSDNESDNEPELSLNPTRLPIIPEEDKYVVLMETNGEECESWYYFIKWQGNEKNLKHLYDQLEKVDWIIIDDLSTFDLDLEHFVCSRTAKEMTKVELNHYSFNRKFDGKLKRVDLNFRRRDKNDKMIDKAFNVLGYGQIDDFIDQEDIDEEDLNSHPEDSSSSEDDTSESESSEEESESEEDDHHSRRDTRRRRSGHRTPRKSNKGIPKSILKPNFEVPRYAKAKRAKNRRK